MKIGLDRNDDSTEDWDTPAPSDVTAAKAVLTARHKRVRKGYERHGEVRVYERSGSLCIEQLRNRIERHTVVLSARECEALGITAALEDVPEPWELVRDAVLAECVFTPTGTGHHDISVGEKAWRAIAKRLGIKSEAES